MESDGTDGMLDIRRRVEEYPYLNRVLGSRWIAREAQIDPIWSEYTLARWLRRVGFHKDLTTLDHMLCLLESTPGIAQRRSRLRSDPPAFNETLTELHFGSWLLSKGLAFDWPSVGADFVVMLDDGSTLPIEVTSPRRAIWMQDLFERLFFVALRFGQEIRIRHESEFLPKGSSPTETVGTICKNAIECLQRRSQFTGRGARRSRTLAYPDLNIELAMKPSAEPGIVQFTSPGPTSPHWGFELVIESAQAKSQQLPIDRPCGLLIGARQLPTHWWMHFTDALRYYRAEDMRWEWHRLPPQVKYIILYSFNLKSTHPFGGIYLINPASPMPDIPVAQALMHSLFPDPLRPD